MKHFKTQQVELIPEYDDEKEGAVSFLVCGVAAVIAAFYFSISDGVEGYSVLEVITGLVFAVPGVAWLFQANKRFRALRKPR